MQIIKPILVCLYYSDKKYPLKIEYLRIRRKIKGSILYSAYEELSGQLQVINSDVIQTYLTCLQFGRPFDPKICLVEPRVGLVEPKVGAYEPKIGAFDPFLSLSFAHFRLKLTQSFS